MYLAASKKTNRFDLYYPQITTKGKSINPTQSPLNAEKRKIFNGEGSPRAASRAESLKRAVGFKYSTNIAKVESSIGSKKLTPPPP